MCLREVKIEVLEMADEAEGGVGGAVGMKKDCGCQLNLWQTTYEG
jgi:hypothetical protein